MKNGKQEKREWNPWCYSIEYCACSINGEQEKIIDTRKTKKAKRAKEGEQ